MTENGSDKFKIRMDDESLEEPIQEDLVDLKIGKLNKRTIFISITIPLLICVILFFAYRDLSRKINRFYDTGTTKVRILSKDLESRFSSLNLNQAKIEDELSKKIKAVIKTTNAIQKDLKETTKAIKYIRIARKKDNKKAEAKFKSINETLSSLPEKLQTITSQLKTIDDKFTKTINGLKNDLLKIQASVVSLSSSKIDKKTFDTALKNEQIVNRQKIDEIKKDLIDQIESFKKKLNKLKKSGTSAGSIKKKTPQKVSVKKSPEKTIIPKIVIKPKPQTKENILPKPGTIIEQDVK